MNIMVRMNTSIIEITLFVCLNGCYTITIIIREEVRIGVKKEVTQEGLK